MVAEPENRSFRDTEEHRLVLPGSMPSRYWRSLLDELLEELAPRFLESTPRRLGRLIERALPRLGELLGVDRATVFEVAEDRLGFRTIHAWAREGAEPFPPIEIRDRFPYITGQALRGKIVCCETIDDLPEHAHADRQALQQDGQQTVLFIPLRVGGMTVGAYSLGTVRASHGWPDSLLDRLRYVSYLLAVALARQQADVVQRGTREELAEVQRIAELGNWICNLSSSAVVGSRQLYAIFQIDPRAELDLRALVDRLHPEDRDRYEHQIMDWMIGRTTEPREYRLIRKNGEIRHVRCWGEVTSDADGNPMRVLGVAQDVTERIRTEQALRNLSRRLLRAHEDERARIARDLHDDLGQQMAALKLQMDMLAGGLDDTASDLAVELTALAARVADISAGMRRLSHGLHPAKLKHLGLTAALSALCREIGGLHPIAIEYQGCDVPHTLPADASLSLYRIAQEALRNVVQHSSARNAWVTLQQCDDQLSLIVADDGAGFQLDAEGDRVGLGLLGMGERMRLVGGDLDIESSPGHGARIRARVWLPEADSGIVQPFIDDHVHTEKISRRSVAKP